MNGINHFKNKKGLVEYASSKGTPAPGVAVTITGLMLLLGGLGVLLGIYTQIALWLIVIFLVGTSFKMHNFWKAPDAMTKMMEQTQFTKNMALAGAALMLMSITEPWVMALSL